MVRRNGRGGTGAVRRHRPSAGPMKSRSRRGFVMETLEDRLALHASLVINEVMFHPPAASDTELSVVPAVNSAEFEFIELLNPSLTEPLGLLNKQLTGDVEFTFPSAQLAPGELAVVAANPAAFAARYGDSVQVFGPWQGELNEGSVAVGLLDADGHTIVDLQLADNSLWPFPADGLRSSLELIDPTTTPVSQLSRPNRWQASVESLGTPGAAGSPASGVIINEVFAGFDTASGRTDQVELLNTSQQSVDMGGWRLGRSTSNEAQYTFPAGVVLGAGEYLVLDADDFNPTPSQPEAHHFQLDAHRGDQLFLTTVDNQGQLARRESSVRWGPTAGQSWGRDSAVASAFTTLSDSSFGAANAGAAFGPALISEVHFHPAPPPPTSLTIDPTLDSDALEYIEVYNPTQQPLDLSGWRLEGVVEFQFAPGTQLAPESAVVVVSFDPALPQSSIRLLAFRQHYGLGPTVPLVGPYQGDQPDNYGRLLLLEPGTAPDGDPDFTPFYLRDEARYDDLAPWPAETDGKGRSLNRRAADMSGLTAEGWLAKSPSPGSVGFQSSPQSRLPDLAIWDDPLLGLNYFDSLDVHPGTGRRIMRFSTAVQNAGDGPLIVRGDEVIDGQQQVLQVVENDDGSTSQYAAGYYVFHPTHGHVHFGDYTLYRLFAMTENGELGPQVAGGEKVSFCLIDSVPFNSQLPGTPTLPVYSSCERQTQGISVGWADIYASDLDDQWIDIEDVPPGTYWLEAVVDPFNHLIESDETNNVFRQKVVLGVPEYAPDELDAAAVNERRLGTGDRHLSSLSIHRPGDIDTFRWIAPSNGTLEVDLDFDRDLGDVDLYVWGTDSQGNVELVSATTEGHGEHASIQVTGGKSYFVVVKELSGDTNPSYSLTIDGPDIPPDRFEPNNSVLQPTDLGSATQTLSDLTIDNADDQDFFAWTAPASATLLLDLQFNSVQGNIDLYVHDFAENEVASSTTNIGRELLEVGVDEGRTYVIIVKGRDGDMVSDYELTVDLLNIPLDVYEPNDSRSEPAWWIAGDHDVSNLSVHKPFNRDFYRWQSSADGPVAVDLLFAQADGDLDLILWHDGESIAQSGSSTSNEHLTFNAAAGQVYLVEVTGKNGATNAQYQLVIDGPESTPDAYEPNDSLLTATDLGEGDVPSVQGNLHASFDSDFYLWTPIASGVVIVDLLFEQNKGDLELVLWADGNEIAVAATEDDNERLFMYIDADLSYVIEVRGNGVDINPSYELQIDSPESIDPPRIILLNVSQSNSPHQWTAPIIDESEGTIPWHNWQHVQIGFSEDVIVQADDLRIEAVSVAEYVLSNFAYNAATHLATWTFASPPEADRLTLTLSDDITDLTQNALDGEFTAFQFPSGNGLPGGAFVWTIQLQPGDYAPDGQLDDRDIDALAAAIQAHDPLADLNNDGQTTTDDLLALVRDQIGTTIGDVNLDGRFDSADLVLMFAAGEYEDTIVGNSTWATGDLNGDGEFSSSDLLFAFQIGGYVS
jgi:hypothetical protein